MQIQDLPRDINCHLSSIRAPLVRLVNSARHSEGKAELLRETLEVALANLPPKVEQAIETPVEAPTTETKKPTRKRATAKVKKDG
jgi:hypothetical protein